MGTSRAALSFSYFISLTAMELWAWNSAHDDLRVGMCDMFWVEQLTAYLLMNDGEEHVHDSHMKGMHDEYQQH